MNTEEDNNIPREPDKGGNMVGGSIIAPELEHIRFTFFDENAVSPTLNVPLILDRAVLPRKDWGYWRRELTDPFDEFEE